MTDPQKHEVEVDWDQVHQTNFASAAFSYTKWIDKAVDLLKTAKKLEPELIDIWDKVEKSFDDDNISIPANYYQESYFMIISFAVENILKAKYIQLYGRQCSEKFYFVMASDLPLNKKLKEIFPADLKSHDLYKLAKLVELDLKDNEEDLLRRLSHNATWAGRYPVPLNHRDMPGLARFSDGKTYGLKWFGSNDVEVINKFIASLPERLGLHVSHKWPVE
jgi:hypothetical protein